MKFLCIMHYIINYCYSKNQLGDDFIYSIGEFSIISEVSTKTLRYYDEINLFKPFNIDENNNYRYYDKNQIGEINFIKELKKYGLSLTEIIEIKDINDKTKLNKILIKQSHIMEQRIKALKEIKFDIDKKIGENELWKNENIEYDIKVVELKSCTVMFVRELIDVKDINILIGRLYELVNNKKLKTKGSHIIKIHENNDERFDIEVFIPIESEREDLNVNKYVKNFDGGLFLKTTHIGIKNKGNAYSEIYDFAKKNSYEITNVPIEKYEMVAGRFLVEIMFKIKNQ